MYKWTILFLLLPFFSLSQNLSSIEEKTGKMEGPFFVPTSSTASYQWTHKRYCHETKEAAILDAEKMRSKKIASLEKQIEKLRKLKFE